MPVLKYKYFWIVIFFVLVAVLPSGCAIVNVPLFAPTQPLQEQVLEGEGNSKILLVDISGIISEKKDDSILQPSDQASIVDNIKEVLKKAESDDAICGLILRINSPGGTVTASDIIHHELMLFKKKTDVEA